MLHREVGSGVASSPPKGFFRKAFSFITNLGHRRTPSAIITMPIVNNIIMSPQPASNHLRMRRPSDKGIPFMRLNSTGEDVYPESSNALHPEEFETNDNRSGFLMGLMNPFTNKSSMTSSSSRSSCAKLIPSLQDLYPPSPTPVCNSVPSMQHIDWLSYYNTDNVQDECVLKSKDMLDCYSVNSASNQKLAENKKSESNHIPQPVASTCNTTSHIQNKDPSPRSTSVTDSSSHKIHVSSDSETAKCDPYTETTKCDPYTVKEPSPKMDRCQVHVTVHHLSNSRGKQQETSSPGKSPCVSLKNMNVEVQMATPMMPRPTCSRKKNRPSAKKRRRIKRRNEPWQPSVSTSKQQQYQDPGAIDYSSQAKNDLPRVSVHQHEGRNGRTMEQGSSACSEKSNAIPSASGSCKSYRVTLLDVTPHSSPDNKSPVWESAGFDVGAGQVAFVFTTSGEESSTDCDNDDDEDLWDSFADQGLCGSFSLNVTCNYIPTSPQEKEPVSHRCREIAEANERWKEAYDDVNCDNMSSSKVQFPSCESSLLKIHPMITWSHAYRAARKGPWEQYARDAERFQKRVEATESALSPVLLSKHRQQVYSKYHAEKQPLL